MTTPTPASLASSAVPRPTPLERLTRGPWWVRVLAVYLGTRVVSAVVLLVVARTQAANLWTPAAPSYSQYTGLMWDASWYRTIAEHGYPAELPIGVDGGVQQNALAFFPLFPAVARLVMSVTWLPWDVVAPTLALLFGTGAALAVHQLMAEVASRPAWLGDRAREGLPLATVGALGLWAAAPVLQVAYTESLALLLLAGALLLLVRRQYVTAIPVVVCLGLARAVAMPFAVAVAAHALARWRADRRGDGELAPGERVSVVALAGTSVLAGFLWPAIVGLMTGEPDAYTLTQGAWRAGGVVVPVRPWLDVAQYWVHGWWPVLLLAAAVLAVGSVLALRRFGPELQGWTAGYFAYLVAVVEPGTPLVRFLVLAFPVAGVAAAWVLRARRRRLALVVLLLLGVAGQVAWVACIWRLVPPSGWPP